MNVSSRITANPSSENNVDCMQISRLLEARKGRLVVKRVFDVVASFIGILILSVFFAIIAVIIKFDSKGTVFYRQIRVGKAGKHFRIFKFRTMKFDADKNGQLLTVGNDQRITKAGHFLRKTKLDELPQIINVLRGEMSFVGPRPEVPRYVELYNETQRQILLMRPGITDIASIEYRNESAILAASEDPERTYIEEIIPSKINLNMRYLYSISIVQDIRIILLTIIKIFK